MAMRNRLAAVVLAVALAEVGVAAANAADDPHGVPMRDSQGVPMQDSQGHPMAGHPEGPVTTPVRDRDAGQLRTMLQRNTGDGTFGRSSTVQIQATVGGGGHYPIVVGGRYNGSYYRGYGYPGLWYYGYRGGFQTSTPVVPVSVPVGYGTVPAPQITSAPPPEPTAEDRAWALLAAGYESHAVDAFQDAVREDAERFETVRALALALMLDGRLDEGVATMRLAYVRDPNLAFSPLDHAVARLGTAHVRRVLRRAVRFAHDRDTASAWLAVAVLMQAEGRTGPAAKMIDRAEARLLDGEIVSYFDRAIGPRSGRSASSR